MTAGHHGIGRYWCDACRAWVWGQSERPYIDIIEVILDRDVVYVAAYSGIPDEYGSDTWSTNMELPLPPIEKDLGYRLRPGKQEPWIRMWWGP